MKRNGRLLSGIVAVVLTILVSCTGSNVPSLPSIASTVNTPTFSPSGGAFVSTQYIRISCAVSGATIRYTTDGSTPGENYGIVYSGNSITVPNTQTIQAIAYKSGYNDSRLASASFSIASTVANPVFTVSGGSYADPCDVGITCTTSGASIRYTTDGLTYPSSTVGTLYTGGAIHVAQSTTPVEIRAIAYMDGYLDSSVSDATYLVTGIVPDPVFSSLSVNDDYTISLPASFFTANPDVVIRYTTDGSTPSRSNGTIYVSGTALTVASSVNAQAIAYVPSWNPASDSHVVPQVYNVAGSVSVPEITLMGDESNGHYLNTVSITMSCSFPGATIEYTIDTPDMANATVYSQALVYDLTVAQVPVITHTIYVYASAPGYTTSSASTTFTLGGSTVANPVFNPDQGNITNVTSVTLTCTTPGAEIFYTTDGSDPSLPASTNVQLYSASAPILLSATSPTDIKAYATLQYCQPSNVVEHIYTITGSVPTVTISPVSGTSDNPVLVSLNLSDSNFTNPNVVIVYTTDGTLPSLTNGKVYAGPFYTGSGTVKAFAYILTWQRSSDSPVTQQTYTVNRTIYCVGTHTSGTSSCASLWKNGIFTDLPSPVNAGTTFANAICDDGTSLYVAGGYFDAGNVQHAYAWRIDPSNNNSTGIPLSSLDGSDIGGSGVSNIASTSQGVFLTGYFTESKVSGYTVTTGIDGNVVPVSTKYSYFRFPCYWNVAGAGYLPSNFVVDPTTYSYPDTFPFANQAVCTAIGSGSSQAGTYARADASTLASTWRFSTYTISSSGEYTADIIVAGGTEWYLGYKESIVQSSLSRAAYFWGSSNSVLPNGLNGASTNDYAVIKARYANGTFYCAGYRKLNTNKYMACYWSGQDATSLSASLPTDLAANTSDSMSVDIGAYSPYIYVGGYTLSSDAVQTPTIWINGTAQTIPTSSNEVFSIKGMIIR